MLDTGEIKLYHHYNCKVVGVYGVLEATVPPTVEVKCKPELDRVVHLVLPNTVSGVLS